MKKYVAPEMVYVDLRAEERVCDCKYEPGECHDEATGDPINIWDGLNS